MDPPTQQDDGRPADWVDNSVAALATHHEPAHLVVDSEQRIVRFLGPSVRHYISPASGTASLGLFDLLLDTLHPPMREALAQAARTGQMAARHVVLDHPDLAALRLDVVIKPMRAPPDTGGPPPFFAVSFYPRPTPEQTGLPVLAPVHAPVSGRPPRLIIDEHRTPDDALRLFVRELETSRHAQVSTNAALRRLNAELCTQNEQLATLNGDMKNLLDSTGIAMLFLDRALRVRSFTSTMTELFALRRLDIGRPVTELKSHLDYPELPADVAEVLDTLRPVEREIQHRGAGQSVFLMRMRPCSAQNETIDGVVVTFVDITDRKRSEQQIWFLAHHDPLTGLPNRAMFHARLAHDLAGLQDTPRRVSLLCMDLDRFKAVNDTFGHRIGDMLLQLVAKRLQNCVHGTNAAFRVGGDEFAVLQNGATSPGQLAALADQIISDIAAPYEIEGNLVQIGVSIGIASSPPLRADADTLTQAADIALYDAKAHGRGNSQMFRPNMDAERETRRMLEADLRGAIARHELTLLYQPIVRLSDRAIVGAEALVGWRHRRHGLLPPAAFIPIAEETGLIVPIGLWVLENSCIAAASWAQPAYLSVNLSPIQLASHRLVTGIGDVLAAARLPPDRLTLEVTESALLHDNGRTGTVLRELRHLGVTITMDGFGTGQSSLSHIRDFAVQKIKIDQTFTHTLDSQREANVIVKAIAMIGDGLGIGVCAEGVETDAQLAALERWGVMEAQGHLFHPPLESQAFASLLRPAPDA